jgi:hypothetical protein
MARPLRIEYEDANHYLCARGNAAERIFGGRKDQARFVELLEESAARFSPSVLAFVPDG